MSGAWWGLASTSCVPASRAERTVPLEGSLALGSPLPPASRLLVHRLAEVSPFVIPPTLRKILLIAKAKF